MRTSLLTITGLLASAFAQYDGARCGAPNPSAALIAEAGNQLAEEDAGRGDTLFQPINVTTYIHVVTTQAAANNYTQTQLNDQIAYMNDAYGPWNITFSLASTDFTVNELWANSTYGSTYELVMKRALRKGGYRDLNLYFLSNLGNGLLGVCRFPVDNPTANQLALDGCVNLAGSIPGGSVARYNLGGTAAHETGHWFGLFHVFQGSACTGKGDYVGDTAVQRNATSGKARCSCALTHFLPVVLGKRCSSRKSLILIPLPSGCPKAQDSCPSKPGLDNIHNYMDYSTDICYQVCPRPCSYHLLRRRQALTIRRSSLMAKLAAHTRCSTSIASDC